VGLDALELTHDYWGDSPVSYLREVAERAGLPIVCYLFDADLVAPPSDREGSLNRAVSLLNRTSELGASLAFVVPAFFKPGVPIEKQRQWLVEGLRLLAAHAQSIGVTIICENCDDAEVRPLMGRAADCRDICAEVDSPALRLIYDAGATIRMQEDPIETLRIMGDYVGHVHVKNNRELLSGETVERVLDSDSGRRYAGTVLDGGTIDLMTVFRELHRTGYEGYINIEYQGEDDPRDAVKHNLEYLRELEREIG
jgi:sugar phosphate isomerase/epimerase